jgi:hypothetical protein
MVRRLMPTVGCEADAIAFTEEQSGSSSSSSDGAAADAGGLLVVSADGSYNTGTQLALYLHDGVHMYPLTSQHRTRVAVLCCTLAVFVSAFMLALRVASTVLTVSSCFAK